MSLLHKILNVLPVFPDEITEEIDAIRVSINTDTPPPPSLYDLTKTSWKEPQPLGGFNPNFPAASNCVELK